MDLLFISLLGSLALEYACVCVCVCVCTYSYVAGQLAAKAFGPSSKLSSITGLLSSQRKSHKLLEILHVIGSLRIMFSVSQRLLKVPYEVAGSDSKGRVSSMQWPKAPIHPRLSLNFYSSLSPTSHK